MNQNQGAVDEATGNSNWIRSLDEKLDRGLAEALNTVNTLTKDVILLVSYIAELEMRIKTLEDDDLWEDWL
jgi:hypothetical protein